MKERTKMKDRLNKWTILLSRRKRNEWNISLQIKKEINAIFFINVKKKTIMGKRKITEKYRILNGTFISKDNNLWKRGCVNFASVIGIIVLFEKLILIDYF